MRVPLLPLLLLLALPALAEAAPFPVTAAPAQVVLGRDKAVVVQVKAPRGTPPLRAMASTGSLQPLPATARGVYSYRWVPPDIRYPLLAVLAFWVDSPTGPPEVTTLHIPLLGRTELDVATDVGAGAEVVVQVAGMRFGPVLTNRKGRALVQVEVPPGVREARVLATAKGQKTDRAYRLDVPPERPLIALLSPDVLPPDTGGWLLVLSESPAPLTQVELQVQGGDVKEVPGTPGVFRVKPEPEASTVVVNAHLKDRTGSARIMAPVSAPIVAHVSPPEPPVAPHVAPATPAWWAPWSRKENLSFHLLAGGVFAGGDNLGPLAAGGVGYRLPPLGGRFTLEAEMGLRRSTSHPEVKLVGTLNARMVAVPVLLSARILAFERGPLALSGRVGAGMMYFEQVMTSQFFPGANTESGRTFTGFLGAQAAWNLGVVSALAELRGSYADVQTTQIKAQPGGLSLCVGVRYAL